MPDDIHVQALFRTLGFYENEIKTYLALAEVGKSTAHLLSKKLQIPRTTTYAALDNLVKKGLVSISQRGSTSFFTANNPQSIKKLIEEEKKQLDSKELKAQELLALLPPYFKSSNFSIPRLQFFEGKNNVERLLFDFLDEWRESMSSTSESIWWGYQDHTFVEQYYHWIQKTWETKPKQEIAQILTNSSKVEAEITDKNLAWRNIKLIPPEFEFKTTIWVAGEYIVLLMTRQEPHYAFQLKDAVFSASLRILFQLLWGNVSSNS